MRNLTPSEEEALTFIRRAIGPQKASLRELKSIKSLNYLSSVREYLNDEIEDGQDAHWGDTFQYCAEVILKSKGDGKLE